MSKPDDLEAVRTVADAVQAFDAKDQQRIFRWAAEKLGLAQPFGSSASTTAHPSLPAGPASPIPILPNALGAGTQDIRSFVTMKKPRNDVQFAAAVAYYYQFEAPQAERKTSISKDDLQDACRKAGRGRLVKPLQTLHNARNLGLLDKGEEAGAFVINSVGENLVAMTLPGNGDSPVRLAKTHAKKRVAKKVEGPPVATKARSRG